MSCHKFVANQVRLELFVLAYNLGNSMRRLALPEAMKHWSLTSLQTRMIKTGGRLVRHARRLVFQLAEVLVSREMLGGILEVCRENVFGTDINERMARRAAAAPVSEVLPHRRRGPETGHRGVWPGPRHLQGDRGGPRGRIWAESDRPGLGARFTFTIPVAQDAAIGAAHLPVRSRRSERERERILAVDDDPQEATSLVRPNDPGLVLLDLMLPGTDGMELMKEIREVSDVPVIFLSVNGQEEIIARAFEMGADDYVVKPFSPTELVARIKAALRKRKRPNGPSRRNPTCLES